jgi:hypothetical protein
VQIRRQAGLFIHSLQSLRIRNAAVVNDLGMGSTILPCVVNNVKRFPLRNSFILSIDRRRLNESLTPSIDEAVLDSWYLFSGEDMDKSRRWEIQKQIFSAKGREGEKFNTRRHKDTTSASNGDKDEHGRV